MTPPPDARHPASTPVAQSLARRAQDKRLLFTVTTGRSGTGYLQHLLAALPGVVCHHEPKPNFVEAMRAAQTDPATAARFWIDCKLPAIVEEQAPIYVETSHLFCKGFLEPLLALGVAPDLIVLKRSHREVAQSLYRIQTVPGRSETGRRYLLCPDDPGVLPLPGWNELHDYQLCYWYCLEIERRAAEYEPLLRERGARVSTVWLHELATFAGFRRVLRELDLPAPGVMGWLRYVWQRRAIVNPKRSFQRDDIASLDYDTLEQQVRERIAAAPATRSEKHHVPLAA